MKRTLCAYFTVLFTFLVLDGLWLGWLMGPTYREWLGPLMLEKPVVFPAVAFYLLYAFGVVMLAVKSALRRDSLRHALQRSALLGLVAYGTYDLTNWATLQGWPAQLAVIDLAWGTFLTAAAGTMGYLATRRVAA